MIISEAEERMPKMRTSLALLTALSYSSVVAAQQLELKDEKAGYLTRAAEAGNVQTAKIWLDNGADVNSRDDYGQPALFLAAKNGHTDFVKLLLTRGADPKAKVTRNMGSHGRTALHAAAQAGSLECFQALQSAGGDLTVKDENGWTVLMDAAYGKNPAIVALTLKSGVDVNAVGKNGDTALLLSLWPRSSGGRYAHPDVGKPSPTVAPLLAAGAKVDVANHDSTPLTLAIRWGDMPAVRMLLEKGANVNFLPKSGMSPLSTAVTYVGPKAEDTEEICKLLLQGGANIRLKDSNVYQKTPLDHVSERRSEDSGRLLRILLAAKPSQ
jgi:uncharacterized protein